MANRNYSDAQRTDAVRQVREGGRSATSVAREMSVGIATLRRWIAQAPPPETDLPQLGTKPTPDTSAGDNVHRRLSDALHRLRQMEEKVEHILQRL